MRTRQEIEEDTKSSFKSDFDRRLIIELLLDIRDLLREIKRK